MRIYSINDVETTLSVNGHEFGIVFDHAWEHIDEEGNSYGYGSYVFTDVMSQHKAYFNESIEKYIDYVESGHIGTCLFNEGRNLYNSQVRELQREGHEVLFCSYNGKFDTDALKRTANYFNIERFLDIRMQMFCIWEFWSMNCPLDYQAKLTTSGKYYSTNAEDVYKFEFGNKGFIEEHIAFSDIRIEKEILLKTLKRSKELPIVKTVKDLDKFIPAISHSRFPNWTKEGFRPHIELSNNVGA
jgi:hypothetical protein